MNSDIELWLRSSENIDRFPELYTQYSQEVIKIKKSKNPKSRPILNSEKRTTKIQQMSQ